MSALRCKLKIMWVKWDGPILMAILVIGAFFLGWSLGGMVYQDRLTLMEQQHAEQLKNLTLEHTQRIADLSKGAGDE